MIFFHKPYYNPNKKNPNDICLKPERLYKVYKLYNAKQKQTFKYRKKFRNQNLKLLNYKDLLMKKNLNFKKQ